GWAERALRGAAVMVRCEREARASNHARPPQDEERVPTGLREWLGLVSRARRSAPFEASAVILRACPGPDPGCEARSAEPRRTALAPQDGERCAAEPGPMLIRSRSADGASR